MTKNKVDFIDRILQFFPMSQEEIDVFAERFIIREFKKGEHLMKAGDPLNCVYFVIKGIIRQYKIIDGVEKSTFFYVEDQMIRLIGADSHETYSEHALACLEDCTVCIAYSKEDDIEFIQKYPRFESLCMILMEDLFKTTQNNQAYLVHFGPEKRYQQLLKERPDIIQRVSQQHLASFLGITPESLSRIRKRIYEKELPSSKIKN